MLALQTFLSLKLYFNMAAARTTYKRYIIHDYHHIVDCHFNEDKLSTSESNENFAYIYNILVDDANGLKCDVSKCIMYKRNHRDRNNSVSNKETNVAMDILYSIHCYLMHSLDVGFRFLPNESNEVTE